MAYFIRDILQQQHNSGFLIQRSTFGCRLCSIDKHFWKLLNLDLVSEGRYYQEIVRLRNRMNSIRLKAEKVRFTSTTKGVGNARCIDLHLAYIQPVMQRIVLSLDINFTKPPELCYSNLSSLTKIVAKLLGESILTVPAVIEFSKVMRLFPFLPDCLYLPTPIRYIGSYTLTQYGRYSFITPIILRCWLRAKYIRLHFLNVLLLVIGRQVEALSRLLNIQDSEILYIYIITLCYARIGASNRILITDSLTVG